MYTYCIQIELYTFSTYVRWLLPYSSSSNMFVSTPSKGKDATI